MKVAGGGGGVMELSLNIVESTIGMDPLAHLALSQLLSLLTMGLRLTRGTRFRLYLEGHEGLVSRLRTRLTRVTVWVIVIGTINLLTSPPHPPSMAYLMR